MNKLALPVSALLSLIVITSGLKASAEEIPETTQSAFAKEVLASNKPVVVDFYATWCGPCKKLAPVMESLSKSYGDKVSFVRVDVDKNPVLAAKYKINGIPSVMVFKGGKVVDNSIGLAPEAELVKMIDKSTN